MALDARGSMYLKLCIVAISLALPMGDGVSQDSLGESRCCPRTSSTWMLLTDPSAVPDFWWEDSVVVDAIEVCPHGISLFFPALANSQPRYVSLTIHKPTPDLLRKNSPSKIGDPPMEARMRRAESAYAQLIAHLSAMSAIDLSRGGRVDLSRLWYRNRPAIVPWQGLTIKWRSTEFKIRGCLDVYYTMFS